MSCHGELSSSIRYTKNGRFINTNKKNNFHRFIAIGHPPQKKQLPTKMMLMMCLYDWNLRGFARKKSLQTWLEPRLLLAASRLAWSASSSWRLADSWLVGFTIRSDTVWRDSNFEAQKLTKINLNKFDHSPLTYLGLFLFATYHPIPEPNKSVEMRSMEWRKHSEYPRHAWRRTW